MQLTKRLESTITSTAKGVVATISTTSVDRDGDVLLPSGINFSDFLKNPVVLFGHRSDQVPIGKALGIQKTSGGVVAEVEFASRPESHPESVEWVPDTIHSLFKQGVLRAFSVGFQVPKDGMREATRKDKGKFGQDVQRVISKWNLLEFSVVTIPANQDALVQSVSKGLINEESWTYKHLDAEEGETLGLTTREPMVVRPREPLRLELPQ